MKKFIFCFLMALMSKSTISVLQSGGATTDVMKPADEEPFPGNDSLENEADPNENKMQRVSKLVDQCTSLDTKLKNTSNCDDSIKMQKLLFQSTQGACAIIIESFTYYNDLRLLIEPSLTNVNLGAQTDAQPVATNLN